MRTAYIWQNSESRCSCIVLMLAPVYESAVQPGESAMKTKHQQAFLQAVTLAADEPNGF